MIQVSGKYIYQIYLEISLGSNIDGPRSKHRIDAQGRRTGKTHREDALGRSTGKTHREDAQGRRTGKMHRVDTQEFIGKYSQSLKC